MKVCGNKRKEIRKINHENNNEKEQRKRIKDTKKKSRQVARKELMRLQMLGKSWGKTRSYFLKGSKARHCTKNKLELGF